MNKKQYIALLSVIVIIVLPFLYKNPLIQTNEYHSNSGSLKIYKQLFKSNKYIIQTPDNWYCFDTKEQMVYLPNWPKQMLGFYHYNFDMSHGVPITFDVKVENGKLNWEKTFFEFSHGNTETYKIIKNKD